MNTFPLEIIGVEAALPGISIAQRTLLVWLNDTGTSFASLDPSMLGPRQLAHSAWHVMGKAHSAAMQYIFVAGCMTGYRFFEYVVSLGLGSSKEYQNSDLSQSNCQGGQEIYEMSVVDRKYTT